MNVTRNTRNNMGTRKGAMKLHQRAQALGVTAGHLSMVLNGKRVSRKLIFRFQQLVQSSEQKNEKEKA